MRNMHVSVDYKKPSVHRVFDTLVGRADLCKLGKVYVDYKKPSVHRLLLSRFLGISESFAAHPAPMKAYAMSAPMKAYAMSVPMKAYAMSAPMKAYAMSAPMKAYAMSAPMKAYAMSVSMNAHAISLPPWNSEGLIYCTNCGM